MKETAEKIEVKLIIEIKMFDRGSSDMREMECLWIEINNFSWLMKLLLQVVIKWGWLNIEWTILLILSLMKKLFKVTYYISDPCTPSVARPKQARDVIITLMTACRGSKLSRLATVLRVRIYWFSFALPHRRRSSQWWNFAVDRHRQQVKKKMWNSN